MLRIAITSLDLVLLDNESLKVYKEPSDYLVWWFEGFFLCFIWLYVKRILSIISYLYYNLIVFTLIVPLMGYELKYNQSIDIYEVK